MDVLARLRSDMDDAGHEAYESGEDETDACLEILDEFTGEHEVVEVAFFPANRTGPPSRVWREGWPKESTAFCHFETIIRPRERKPSLLEAAEALHVAAGKVATLRAGDIGTEMGAWEELRDADAALAEAIAKEKSNA